MSSRMLRLGVASIVLSGLIAGSPVSGTGLTEIQIQHDTNRVLAFENGNRQTSEGYPLAANPTIEVPRGNEVHVTIQGANPLLFEYSLEKLEAIATSDSKTLASFAGTLQTLLTSLGSPVAGEDTPLDFRKASRDEVLCHSAEQALEQFRKVVKAASTAQSNRQKVIRQSLLDAQGAKSAVIDWKVEALQKDLASSNEALASVTADLLAAGSPELCTGTVALARTMIPDTQRVLDDLSDIAALINEIGKPITLPSFIVNPSENQPVKVTIAQSKNMPDGLNSTRFVGGSTITVAPRSRLGLSVAPAAVYSFVRDPSYEVQETDGQLFIRETESPYKELDLAAMLLMEPHAWDLGPVGLGVQLGVSPQDDLGLFLGLTLRAGNLFTFGAGVAFQEVDRLGKGLAPDQAITSRDLFKTEEEFDQGLYLHLTVSLPNSN